MGVTCRVSLSFAAWISSRLAPAEQNSLRLRRQLGIQGVEHESGSLCPNPATMLVDAGQRYPQRIVIVKVAASDDGNIVWHPEALIHCLVDGSHCHRIIEAEYPSGTRLQLKSCRMASVPRWMDPTSPLGSKITYSSITVFPFCPSAFLYPRALDAGTRLRPPDMSDPLAANIH